MEELKDDDILNIQEPEMISDEDILEETPPPSMLERLKSGAEEFVNAPSPLGPSLKETGETALDFSKGVARGLTMESLDELGGLAGAGIEKGLGALGIGPAAVDAQLAEQGFTGAVDKPFSETYREYQQNIEKDLEESEQRSPTMTLGGQIAGGITSGVALGGAMGLGKAGQGAKTIADIAKDSGKAKAALELLKRGGTSYAKAAPFIGLEAGLTSKEQLIGEDAQPMELAKDVAGGLAFGLPAVMGMEGISQYAVPKAQATLGKVGQKIDELVENVPLLRQSKIAYQKYGKEAQINPKSEKAILEGVAAIEGGTPFSQINTKRATDITAKVLKADQELGKLVGNSIDDASKAGLKVSAQDIVEDTFNDVITLSQEMPSILKDPNFNATMQKILKRDYNNVSPREIKNALEDITTSIDRISVMKYSSPEFEQAASLLRKMRRTLDVRLKESVPQYRDAAERFSQFRTAYMEQPIAGKYDPNIEDIMYGDLKKGQSKLIKAYEDLVSSTTADNQAVEGVEAAYSKLAKSTKDFETGELKRMSEGKIQAPVMPGSDKFMKGIKDSADDAAVRRATRRTQESQGGVPTGIKDVVGVAQAGRGMLLSTSYLAGRTASSKTGQKVANMSRNLYNLPNETLSGVASKLENNAVTSMYGKALREGLQNGDAAKKNAALFTIMQNPNARMLIEAEDDEEEGM